jgi:trehalose 6-phosphate phosphatase
LDGGAAAYAFFLDVDGTLLEMAPTPDLVRVDAGVLTLLEGLREAAGGALALVSGRTVTDMDRLFAPLQLPAAGQHGAERRDAAGVRRGPGPGLEQLERVRASVTAWAAGIDGLLVEDKGICLAVHFRQAPHLEELVYRRLGEFIALAGGALSLQPGRMVLEAKPVDRNKGSAVGQFMAEAPFAGRIPLFVGDDLTDEDGFAAARRLGGHAVKVGEGDSIASWRLPDVDAVRNWLGGIARGAAP